MDDDNNNNLEQDSIQQNLFRLLYLLHAKDAYICADETKKYLPLQKFVNSPSLLTVEDMFLTLSTEVKPLNQIFRFPTTKTAMELISWFDVRYVRDRCKYPRLQNSYVLYYLSALAQIHAYLFRNEDQVSLNKLICIDIRREVAMYKNAPLPQTVEFTDFGPPPIHNAAFVEFLKSSNSCFCSLNYFGLCASFTQLKSIINHLHHDFLVKKNCSPLIAHTIPYFLMLHLYLVYTTSTHWYDANNRNREVKNVTVFNPKWCS